MNSERLDELKFHWKVWKGEAKSFWLRSSIGSALLLISLAFQFGILRVSLKDWVTIISPWNPRDFYKTLNCLSWLLFGFIVFKFIDLLRHRIPNDLASKVHNEWLLGVPVGKIGQAAYLIFIGYFGFLAYLLYHATEHTWHGDLTQQIDYLRSDPTVRDHAFEKGAEGYSKVIPRASGPACVLQLRCP